MMWNSWGNTWGGGFGFGWIFVLLFWGLIIWGIYALVRGATGHGCCGGHGPKGNNAMDILKERYAKGEISKEDFDKMRKDLE